MTTSSSVPTSGSTSLQPVPDDMNLLATSESTGSCCGGSCSTD
ncbi:hypothetical protein ACFQZV_07380 [Microbacterium koreense]|uniref:FxLD family lantipeptide n=1 Tax=Microbacterium koreense TaxID=323761 RepID=A0ABW2ZRE4_9MICO